MVDKNVDKNSALGIGLNNATASSYASCIIRNARELLS
jgi:hypothetical protein